MNATTETLRQEDIAFQANLYEDKNPTRRWLHRTRRDWVMAKIDSYCTDHRTKVLEVGVGAGIYTRHLVKRGCSVMAVDINSDFLTAVADLPNVSVSNCDACDGLPGGGYDVAICSEVLEHVPPERSIHMLRNISQSLKPGGVLIFSTPQRTSTMENMVRLLKWRPFMALAKMIYGKVDDLGHINTLTAAQLRSQFWISRLAIAEKRKMALYLPLLAEFGGEAGQRIAERIETSIRDNFLSRLLWTQAYVLKRCD